MIVKVAEHVPQDILVFTDEVLEDGVLLEWRERFGKDHESNLFTTGYISGILSLQYNPKCENFHDLYGVMCGIQSVLLHGIYYFEEKEVAAMIVASNPRRTRELRVVRIDGYCGVSDKDIELLKERGHILHPSPWPIGLSSRFGLVKEEE